MENGQAARGNVAAGMKTILVELAAGAEDALGDPFVRRTWRQNLEEVGEFAGSLERTIADGLAQTWKYADRCAANEVHLVVFDRDPAKSWSKKTFRRAEVYRGAPGRPAGFPVAVWGM